jgi:hypothetical protein
VDFESLREESDSFRGVTKNLFVDEKTARLMYYRIGCVLRAVLALETTPSMVVKEVVLDNDTVSKA